MASPSLTLLTFAPMIDSEAARLLLRHYRVTFVERDRLFCWVSILTLRHGGHGIIPLVFGSGKAMSGPRAIVARFESDAGERRLIADDDAARAAADADWQRYNLGFGTDVATLAYFHLLPERAAMIASWGARVTPVGRATLPFVYPLLATLFRRALGLKPDHVAAAAERVACTLDTVDAQLADGRTFLAGDKIGLADFAFAAAAAPLILPEAYAPQLPPWPLLPIAFRDLVAHCRKRPSAALVLRIYSATE